MKKTLLFITSLISAIICFSDKSAAQTTITSTTGYSVSLNVFPVSIVPATNNNCDWGYNYQVKMHYNISINGANAPASLYTLQGTIGCGSTTSFFDLPNSGGAGNVNSASAWSSTTDCNSATVNSKACNSVKIQIGGPGIIDQIVNLPAVNIALPIKLINFSAAPDQNKVRVAWATDSEENNDYFTVERSSDGTSWEEVKKLKGASKSSSLLSYEVYDLSPIEGTSFYRLKQTDVDGKTSFSNIYSVKYRASSKGISLFPIPSSSNTLNIAGINNYKNYELMLMDTAGNLVYKTGLTGGSVDLPSIKAGVYIVRVTDKVSGASENLRYIKM